MLRILMIPAILLGVGIPALASPYLNLSSALADTKAELAAGRPADILVLGDSLSYKTGSYLPYFRDLMQAHYGNGGAGYQGFSLWTGAGFNNGWLRQGINMDVDPHHSLDGLWSDYVSGSPWPNNGYFVAQSPTIQLQYLRQPGGGSIQLNLADDDKTFITTLDTNAAAASVGTWTYTFPEGESRIDFKPKNDGPLTILGMNNTQGTAGVRIHRAANGGWGVGNFLQRDWTFDDQLDLIHPDLLMIWLGQNDQGYSRSQYAVKIGQLVDRIQADQPNAEIVLIGTYDSGGSNIHSEAYGMEDVARDRGLGFINIYEVAGDYQYFLDHGYVLSDGVHFSAAGGDYLGNMLYNAFQTDGASLTPEPDGALVLCAGAGLLLLWRRKSRRATS